MRSGARCQGRDGRSLSARPPWRNSTAARGADGRRAGRTCGPGSVPAGRERKHGSGLSPADSVATGVREFRERGRKAVGTCARRRRPETGGRRHRARRPAVASREVRHRRFQVSGAVSRTPSWMSAPPACTPVVALDRLAALVRDRLKRLRYRADALDGLPAGTGPPRRSDVTLGSRRHQEPAFSSSSLTSAGMVIMQSCPVGSSHTCAGEPLGCVAGTGRRVIPSGCAPTQWMCVRGIAFTAGLSSRTGSLLRVCPRPTRRGRGSLRCSRTARRSGTAGVITVR
ncbi:hypothetical protein SHL15_7709 [Streptomyces hygroscopicus subsp. limoneus]|nr:hypothetical protein SHL15_7709 [Streptomyces hygroscopicus subsp. limoneus]